ncbi:ALK tyrosine kinase receptor-like [Amblyraja radiata]|uniref:ALK tyrosine kinase receptor-like n=1 Tax=Amblyraja radiata TaxID=386614 RepID=UPI001404151D|nr:ALK tyrosine kinase receptor-like [Amblyraja radiata]
MNRKVKDGCSEQQEQEQERERANEPEIGQERDGAETGEGKPALRRANEQARADWQQGSGAQRAERAEWTLLQGKVGSLEDGFRFSLEYKGNSRKNWELTALDSVTLKNCHEGPLTGSRTTLEGTFSCWNGVAIKLRQLCDFTEDCSKAEDEGSVCSNLPAGSHCSFEEDDCGWFSVTSEMYEPTWTVKDARSSSEEPGRKSCYSEGHFLFLDTKEIQTTDFNELRSMIFPSPIRNSPCEGVCLWDIHQELRTFLRKYCSNQKDLR